MTDPTPHARRSPMEHERDAASDISAEAVEWLARTNEAAGFLQLNAATLRALAAERDALRLRVEAAEGVCRSLAQSYDHDLGVYALGELHRAREMADWLTSPAQKGPTGD